MTEETTRGRRLSDTDYVGYATRNGWSPTEAIYLLSGFAPPDANVPPDALRERFPEATRAMSSYSIHCDSLRRGHDVAPLPLTPQVWAEYGFGSRPVNDRETWPVMHWAAVFPFAEMQEIASRRGYFEQDYRQFVNHLIYDLDLSLDILIRFALTLPPSCLPRRKIEYERLVREIYAQLPSKAKRGIPANPEIEDLGRVNLKPQEFLKLYPTDLSLDPRCQSWHKFGEEHAALIKALRRWRRKQQRIARDSDEEQGQKTSGHRKKKKDLFKEVYEMLVNMYVADKKAGATQLVPPLKKWPQIRDQVLSDGRKVQEVWRKPQTIVRRLYDYGYSPKKDKRVIDAKPRKTPR